MQNDRLIEKASRKFKFVSRSKIKKFKFLPEWVLSEASYFEKEIKRPTTNHKIYKRGSLVFIDFGVNVGNELSGPHFGIVLNKRDSRKNGVLTVIPVSSKSNKFSVELDELISLKSIEFLRRSLIELEVERKILGLHEIKEHLTDEEKTERIVTHSLNGDSHVEHYKYMTTADFNNRVSVLEKELNELDAVIKTYHKFNKTSYAKCLDIRTISKSRVLKINQFDPVGKIRVSDETLSKIDKVIIENFIQNV